jgi:Holliday junction resolvase-like predicted endonuclease
MYLIFSLLGQNVKCEVHSALGRADCIVETKSYVYIFEFKLDRSSEEALKQITERKYALPYQSDQRHVYQIGVSFSSHERNITSWQIQ